MLFKISSTFWCTANKCSKVMPGACVCCAIQFQQKRTQHIAVLIFFDMHPIDRCDQIKSATSELLLVLVLGVGHQGEAPAHRSPLSGADREDPEFTCHLEDLKTGF